MNRLVAIPVFLAGALGGFAVNALPARAAAAGDAASPKVDDRVFELRTYTVAPGQLAALNRRFRDHTMTIFARHGMASIGYWTPMDTALAQTTLVYIIAHASRDAAAKNWAEFRADPEWQKVSAATAAEGLKVLKVESVFATPTDYSPIR